MPALGWSCTRILGTNSRCGAAAPCCDPNVTVASSARRYCGAFTELSITAALTSTGTRILGTNIDLLSSFLRLSSDRSRCIGLGQSRGHELAALPRKRGLGGGPVWGPSKGSPEKVEAPWY